VGAECGYQGVGSRTVFCPREQQQLINSVSRFWWQLCPLFTPFGKGLYEVSGTAAGSGDKLMTPKPTAIGSTIQRNLGSAVMESPS